MKKDNDSRVTLSLVPSSVKPLVPQSSKACRAEVRKIFNLPPAQSIKELMQSADFKSLQTEFHVITLQQVVEYNQKHINWDKFFSLVDTVGPRLNSLKDRFEKSDLFERALETFSNGNVKYVNDNGVDHILINLPDSLYNPTTQEMKFVTSSFYTEKKLSPVERASKNLGISSVKEIGPSNKPITLKLLNSMGSNSHKTLPENYAKFLLVADKYSIHIIEVATLVPYLKFGGDGIEAFKVPYNLFQKVVGPSDIKNRQTLDYNYKEEKNKFQRDFLNKF